MNLKELDTSEAMQIWPLAEEHLRAAVSELEENPDIFLRQIKAKVFSGIHSLWILEDGEEPAAYAVTALYTGDGIVTVAQIYLAEGTLELFLEQQDSFTVWALKHGASCIEIIGRKGWERVLKPHGFMYNYTSLLRQITEELH